MRRSELVLVYCLQTITFTLLLLVLLLLLLLLKVALNYTLALHLTKLLLHPTSKCVQRQEPPAAEAALTIKKVNLSVH